jgi:hypothetical protein
MSGIRAIIWGLILTFGSLAIMWWISTLTHVSV